MEDSPLLKSKPIILIHIVMTPIIVMLKWEVKFVTTLSVGNFWEIQG